MSKDSEFIIAVDGVTASGKGTISKLIAQHYNFDYLDTGKLYRIVAHHVRKNNVACDDVDGILSIIDGLRFDRLDDAQLRGNEIGQMASKISVFPQVRERLNKLQYDFPKGKSGVVLDGRDIGTVIFPNAPVKFFVTADQEVRAKRRYDQIKRLEPYNESITYDLILHEVQLRDDRDINRSASPCIAAYDAIILDTTNLTPEETLELAIKHIDVKLAVCCKAIGA